MFYKTSANIFLIRFYRITIHTQWRFTYQKGVDMHDGRGSRMQKRRRALSRKKYSSDVMALLVVLLSTSTIYGVVVVSIKTGFTLGHFQKIMKKNFYKLFSLHHFKFSRPFSPTLAILGHYIYHDDLKLVSTLPQFHAWLIIKYLFFYFSVGE